MARLRKTPPLQTNNNIDSSSSSSCSSSTSTSSNNIKGHSLEFRKKHFLHAKALEKVRREEIIFKHVASWLIDSNALTPSALQQYLSCIKQLVKVMGYDFKKDFVKAVIIYGDIYIMNASKISTGHLFKLLLISSVVAVKFWEDSGIDLDLCSYVFGISKKEISAMERHFLSTINFKLQITNDDLVNFDRYIPAIPSPFPSSSPSYYCYQSTPVNITSYLPFISFGASAMISPSSCSLLLDEGLQLAPMQTINVPSMVISSAN